MCAESQLVRKNGKSASIWHICAGLTFWNWLVVIVVHELHWKNCQPLTIFQVERGSVVFWSFAAGRFLAAAGRLARNCLRRCGSFWRAFSMGSSAFFLPSSAHATHSSGAQSPQPIRRAKPWLLSICLAVGECRAELCANSLERARMFSFSFSVAGCRFCVCRNHPLISVCNLSLLARGLACTVARVFPKRSKGRDLVRSKKDCRC